MKLIQDFYSGRHQFWIIAHPLSRAVDGRTVLVGSAKSLFDD
jgi:hypothetical protein